MDHQPPRFSDREVERYARHLVLREIGGPGQQRLKAARVLLVGAGGIGAPAALYLAAAGVGALGILDDDTVALSNLQRQVLYAEADIGRPKVEAAAERLGELNSDITVVPVAQRLTPQNARSLIEGWDLVIDGSDSFETRAAVGEACVAERVPLVAAAIGRWEAQIAVLKGGPGGRGGGPGAPPGAGAGGAGGGGGARAGGAGARAARAAGRAGAGAGPD